MCRNWGIVWAGRKFFRTPVRMTPHRAALFLIGCIGTRAALAYIAAIASSSFLPILGAIALIPAIGFVLIYKFDLRKTGAEVFGEKIWWNDLRPVHAAIYGAFAVAALAGWRRAWVFLAADVVLGLGAFIHHHYLS